MKDLRDTTLLPPNAKPQDRAIEAAMRADIDFDALRTLLDPMHCPEEVLPFLAAEVAISHWDSEWTLAEKRAAVAAGSAFHKIKGTRAAVEQVLARFHPQLRLVESGEAGARRQPHRFEVRADAQLVPVDFLTEEVADALVRDIAAAKPLRSHFDFVQSLASAATVYMAAGGLAGTMNRSDYDAARDDSRDWDVVLQTEIGEPIRLEEADDFLEHQ